MKAISILAVPPIVVGLFVCLFILSSPYGLPAVGHGETYSEPLLSQVIERERIANKLPKGMIEAVITVESNWDETAYNPETNSKCARSGRKDCASAGLMGLVDRWHGKSKNLADHIRRGAKHLGEKYREAGTAWGAFKGYNGTGKAAEIYANRAMKQYAIWKRLG